MNLNYQAKIYQIIESMYLLFAFYYRIVKTSFYLFSNNLTKESLKMAFDSKNEIFLPWNEQLRIINPSITNFQGNLLVAARITNAYYEENADYAGRPIQTFRQHETHLLNGIVLFRINEQGSVSDFKVLNHPSKIPNFEDPRIFIHDNHLFIVMTKVLEERIYSEGKWRSSVSLRHLDSNEILDFQSPLGLGIEKNWIPIPNEKSISLMYSSNPLATLQVNFRDKSFEYTALPFRSSLAVNNRTQLVKTSLKEFPYIRIVSKKFANFRVGYTPFHYFQVLSETLEPLLTSRPFVFSRIQMEICNGLTIIDNNLVFTWTEREKVNMIGFISLNRIIENFFKY
jgi:hypothetical protein